MASTLIGEESRVGIDELDTDTLDLWLTEAAEAVKSRVGTADVAVVLGSGLGTLVDELVDKKAVSFSEIPHMPTSGVVGHAGEIMTGYLGNNKILCFAGRVHAYEGYEPFELCFHARLMAYLGVKLLMTSNAAGTTTKDVKPGSIVELVDVLNLRLESPLGDVAHDGRFGPRLLDTSTLFSPKIHKVAAEVRKLPCFTEKERAFFQRGVYSWNSGPSYETPTEVQVSKNAGVVTVGMSTIPEVLACRSLGIEVYAVSLVTNYGAGLSMVPLDHKEVKQMAKIAGPLVAKFFREIINGLDVSAWPSITRPKKFDDTVHKLPYERGLVIPRDLPNKAAEGAKWLRDKLAGRLQGIASLWVMGPGFAELAVSQGTVVETGVKLGDIVGFTGGDVNASVYISTTGAFVIGCTWESGLHEDEATFIGAVAHELGATSIAVCHAVGTLDNSEFSVGSSDVIGGTMSLLEFLSIAPPPIWHYHSDGHVSFSLDEGTIVERDTQDKHAYAPVHGPAIPQPIQCDLAKHSGCDVVGVFSLSCYRAAQRLAMRPVIVGHVAYDVSDSVPIDTSGFGSVVAVSGVDAIHKLIEATKNDNSVTDHPSLVDIISPEAVNPWLLPFTGRASQVRPQLVEMAVQEIIDGLKPSLSHEEISGLNAAVAEACRYRHLRSWLERAETPEVEKDFKAPDPTVEPLATVDHPWPLHAVGLIVDPRLTGVYTAVQTAMVDAHHIECGCVPGGLVTGRLSGRRVWLIRGSAYDMVADLNTGPRTVSVRVLDYLGVTTLVLIPAITSATTALKAGELVRVADHVNFTGQSPLYGHNYRSHGKRFMDMGTAYAPTLSELHESVHGEQGGSMASAVIMFSRLAHYATAQETRLAVHLCCSGMTASCIPESVVARHCLMQSTGLGVVTTMGLGLGPQAVSLSSTSERAVKHVITFLKGLHVVRNAHQEVAWIEELQRRGTVPRRDEEKGYEE